MYKPTIEDVKGEREWSLLEKDLLDECKFGRGAYLPGKEDCPKDQSDPDRRVRADLIRYLLLGGCKTNGGARPHPKGVQIEGAWIDGVLDFQGCTTRLNLALHHCFFREGLSFQDAELGGLYLTGSRAEQGVNLHRLTTKSNVQLRGGFHATGLVDLGGARIGGQLDCDGGRFDEAGEIAINCNAVRIKADALLRNAFHASRKVDFARARIEGDLQIIKARLDLGITLDGARVGGGLFWQDMQDAVHDVDLTEAQVRVLADDMASWEQVKVLHLSGFTYERIQSDMGIVERLRWLADKRERKISPAFGEESEFMGQKFKRSPPWIKGTDTPDFDPQPYTQLAKVLDTQGNRGEASRVRYEREKRMRPAALRRSQAQLDGSGTAALLNLFMTVRPIWDVPYRWVFGYSHLPALALIWIGLIWLLAFLLYGSVYAAGQMAPNSDVILTSADWLAQVTAYEPGGEMPMHAWLSTPAAKDYETFSAGLYALDLFLPLDALGQEAAWAPSKERGALGALGYWMRMPIQLAGWVITAVGAAVLTGLVGRKE